MLRVFKKPGFRGMAAFLPIWKVAHSGKLPRFGIPAGLAVMITVILLLSGCPQVVEVPSERYTILSITFDSHGGTAVGAITQNTGTRVPKPADPTRPGYTFLGWFSAETGGTLYSWPHTLIADITMHAQWWENTITPPTQYTITFDSHGGTMVGAITQNTGTQATKPADPTRAGYTFLGWYSAETGGMLYSWPHTLTANITMHAQWWDNTLPPPMQYTITFDSHGGTGVGAVTQNTGTQAAKPADPTRPGYTFLGWYTAENGGTAYTWPHTLTGNVTMHARWVEELNEEEQAAIDDFKDNDTVKEALETGIGDIDLELPADELAAVEAAVNEALNVYDTLPEKAQEALAEEKAKLESVKEKIENVNTAHEFLEDHGKVFGTEPETVTSPEEAEALLSELEAIFNEAAALPDGVKDLLAEEIERLENLNEKAKEIISGEKSVYTITFDSQGGTAVTAITANEGTQADKPTDPTRRGYMFLGWYSAENGGTQYVWPHTLTGNVTMHAQWQENSVMPSTQYTITFDSQGGTAVGAITQDMGTQVGKPTDPTKVGYTFLGWYSAENGGTQYVWPHTLYANVTMYAQWWKNTVTPSTQYTITFDSQGGTAVTAITANEGSQTDKPADPTRTGYTFTGWFSGAGWGTQYDWPHTLYANVTMYAAWTANTYTVAYDANGGNGTMMSSIHTYGMDKNLSANAFTRTGYAFAGWNTQADGEGTGYTGGQGVSNLASAQDATVTLYAQWSVITYSISYTLNNGIDNVNEAGTYAFPDAVTGYGAQSPITVTVSNTGNQTTGALNIVKSETNYGSFTLSKTGINDIVASGNDSFTVAPVTGLAEGTYTATIMVSGGNGINVSFDVRFTVTAAPGTLSITVGFNLGAIAIMGSDETNLIRQTTGAPSSLEFNADGYTGVVWYVDGNTSAPISGDTLTINASNYTTKLHSVTFTGYKNGTPYAQVIPFTVLY